MKNSDGSGTRKLKGPMSGRYGKVIHVWNLNSPSNCRHFLESLRFDGKQAEYIQTESGSEIYFKDMNDEQLILYANEIAGWF